MRTCFNCKKKSVAPDRVAIDHTFGSVKVIVENVPVEKCADCGEWTIGAAEGDRADQLMALAAIAAGVRTGHLLKWSRSLTGLRATELGELLGVSPETVSRWENGHRDAEPAIWNVLADLVRDALHGTSETRELLSRAPAKGIVRARYDEAA